MVLSSLKNKRQTRGINNKNRPCSLPGISVGSDVSVDKTLTVNKGKTGNQDDFGAQKIL